MFGKFNYRTDKIGTIPNPPRFRKESKTRATLTPRVEKYIIAYPLTEEKKLAVCNFLVNSQRDGAKLKDGQ